MPKHIAWFSLSTLLLLIASHAGSVAARADDAAADFEGGGWEQATADVDPDLENGDDLPDGDEFKGPVRASFYGVGDGFGGRRTSCGTRMNPRAMTFAHKWVGTNVVTVDPKTGKKTRKRKMPCGQKICFRFGDHRQEATATDSGPYAAGRTFDLSNSLAKALRYQTDKPLYYRIGSCQESADAKKPAEKPQTPPTPPQKPVDVKRETAPSPDSGKDSKKGPLMRDRIVTTPQNP